LEDFVNALWKVITALDFYKFKLEFTAYINIKIPIENIFSFVIIKDGLDWEIV